MPRTKRNKATSNSMKERDAAVKTFEKRAQLCIAKMEREAMADLKTFVTCIDVIISRLPKDIRQMKLGELINRQDHDNEKENCNDEVSSSVKDLCMQPPAIPKVRKGKVAKRTAASDDGYATGGTSVGSTSRVAKALAKATPAKRTRSTRASRAKLSEINQTMTPAMPKSLNNVYNVVTPKVKPNTPLNVLRRPRQGEMVLSMQGSPLLVSAVVEEKTANINVPLSNGNVMSLLPQEGLRMSNIPPLDPETMHQLETLKKHIEKVIALK
ncbi:Borealin [Trachymyrmex zeteki]|uniref:Borealin n=1 Tax=Mycetomoellerius zeteki TaxID=64791 RepID=A0A151X354_9HYME|nr:PREDICTED: borealin [Trachymyrmex zeteki]KYQ54684.1 Borealin [Trachymyrmex zeteki]